MQSSQPRSSTPAHVPAGWGCTGHVWTPSASTRCWSIIVGAQRDAASAYSREARHPGLAARVQHRRPGRRAAVLHPRRRAPRPPSAARPRARGRLRATRGASPTCSPPPSFCLLDPRPRQARPPSRGFGAGLPAFLERTGGEDPVQILLIRRTRQHLWFLVVLMVVVAAADTRAWRAAACATLRRSAPPLLYGIGLAIGPYAAAARTSSRPRLWFELAAAGAPVLRRRAVLRPRTRASAGVARRPSRLIVAGLAAACRARSM